jgi:uncharacterized membrane protein YfcA
MRAVNALQVVLAVLVMGAGACLQGAVGFGSNLIAAPLLILIDDTFVPGPIVVGSIVLNILVMRREGRGAYDTTVNSAMVGQVFGALAAGLVLAIVSEDGLSLLFAGLVLLAVVVSAAGWHLALNRRTLAGAGVAAGFMGTISGIGGPPIALVYQRADGPTLRATLSRFFLVGGFISLAVLAASGKLGTENVPAIVIVVPASVLGFLASGRLIRHVDKGSVRPVVLTLSALAAVAVLARELL